MRLNARRAGLRQLRARDRRVKCQLTHPLETELAQATENKAGMDLYGLRRAAWALAPGQPKHVSRNSEPGAYAVFCSHLPDQRVIDDVEPLNVRVFHLTMKGSWCWRTLRQHKAGEPTPLAYC